MFQIFWDKRTLSVGQRSSLCTLRRFPIPLRSDALVDIHPLASLQSDPRKLRLMYAIVTNVRVENPEEARLLLPHAREDLVSRAPGIVSGYWLEPIDGIGTSVIVFETKEYAEDAAKYPVPAMPGVTQLDTRIREVFAHV
jgi:hypothetical protein